MKIQDYAKYKLLSSGVNSKYVKLVQILTAAFVVCVFFISEYIIVNNVRSQLDSNEFIFFTKGIVIFLFLINLYLALGIINKFLSSKEYSFLRSLSFKVNIFLMIIFFEIFPSASFLSIISSSFIITNNVEFYLIIYIFRLIEFFYISLILFILVLLYIILYRMKISLLSNILKVIAIIIFLVLPIIAVIQSITNYTSQNKQNIILSFYVLLGQSQIVSAYYDIIFNISLSVVLAICSILFLVLLLELDKRTINIRSIFHSREILSKDQKFCFIKRKNNKLFIKRIKILASFLKDIILLKKGIIIFNACYLLIFGILTVNSMLNNICLYILLALYIYIFASWNIFEIDSNSLILHKSFILKRYHFFGYKFFTVLVNTVMIPIFTVLICLILDILNLYEFFILLLIIISASIILCLNWSLIIYYFYPNTKNASIPIMIIAFLLIIFPPVVIPIIIVGLFKMFEKWDKMEV